MSKYTYFARYAYFHWGINKNVKRSPSFIHNTVNYIIIYVRLSESAQNG